MQTLGLLVVGVYAWAATVALGATLLDVVYAAQPDGGSTAVPAEAGDLLLALWAGTVVIAIAAVVASRGNRQAQLLLVASLAVVLVGMLIPAASGLGVDVEQSIGIRVGPWLRLGVTALPSILAFAALWACWRGGGAGDRAG
jgi:hypothetical protein